MYFAKTVIRSKSRWLNRSFVSKATFGHASRKFIFSAPTTSMEANFSWDVQSPLSHKNFRCKSTLLREIYENPTFPKSFCEWLAGIIDGEGSIEVGEQKQTMLCIIMGPNDLPLLRYIQRGLGGRIKMRADGKSYDYRIQGLIGMTKLVNCINGHIRHSRRLHQLHCVCQVLDIPIIQPIKLDARSNWFAGFFDANGIIDIEMNHLVPQLSVRVINRLLPVVEPYKVVFGGKIHYDSGENGYYRWSIQSRKDIFVMEDYFISSTFRSYKSRRFSRIREYYRLYDLRAFRPESIYHDRWRVFLKKWNKYRENREAPSR